MTHEYNELRATIDRLTKERDQAVAEADPELLTIAWMDGSHRSAKAARDEIKRLTTRLSAMQEAIDEAVRRADRANAEVMPCTIEDVAAVLRPFATKPEPEVEADPLVEAIAELQLAAFLAGRGSIKLKADGRTRVALPGPTMDDYRQMAAKALAARGGRVVFDGREG